MLEDKPPSLAWDMWKRFLLAALIVVVLSAGTTATGALLQVSTIAHNLFPSANKIACQVCGAYHGGPETFMIIGSDKRPKAKAIQDRTSPPHSDTMMLIRMDPDKGETSVLSIPRDLKVTIGGPGGGGQQKINAAYSLGGTQLALKTVKAQLPGITINHVLDVTFSGFRKAVDAVRCVYVDIDRRYFNDNATAAYGQGFATINVPPGYQRMCGQTALDYVRYRHTDSDFVRVARQQDFVRQFRAQVGVQGLIDHADALEKAVGSSIQTDITNSTSGTLQLLKLVANSLTKPVRQVHFQATPGPSFVTATPANLQATVHDFLYGPPPATPQRRAGGPARGRHARAAPSAGSGAGLTRATRADEGRALGATRGLPFGLYYPRRVLGTGALEIVRRYDIRDLQGQLHHAYRLVFNRGLVGEYWGVQGMDWTNPPILEGAKPVSSGGRSFQVVFDGQHVHVVAWQTPHALYWVSNTLLEGLTNQQMFTIARSALPLH